ncbi:DUF58 domain-containing protein [Chthonobacter albigriseus]|uniref:DUF58 domain-containing protein n=1 Tax=Chthonobacter albigriseus TaxID=1683161 RepID=UPI0015EFA8BD|nr:DUF58 domain-containing protein [Chthonobacter albigriseus]
MVTGPLDRPGIRLTAPELIALRETGLATGRHRPATRRPGAVPAKPPGAGIDLREIRAFVDGDDARRIDPAATARTGLPHIRSFHEDRDDTVLLIADFRPAMLWGTRTALRSVRGARAVAERGWRAVARGASVSAMGIDAVGVSSLPLGAGAAHMNRIAWMLASLHDRALSARRETPDLAAALTRAASLAPPGAEVVLAAGADSIAAADEPALARLARRRRVTLLLPLDPAEIAPPAAPVPIRCGPLGRVARLVAFDPVPLARHLRTLNVMLEIVTDDTG